MTENYKVLSAILALKEFTIVDLIRLSEVKPATVRTAVNRFSEYIQSLGEDPPSRRGGRHKRYRVKPAKLLVLRAKVQEELDEAIRHSPPRKSAHQLEPPPELLTAEDALTVRFAETPDHKNRIELVRIARVDLAAAKSSLKASLVEGVDPDEVAKVEKSVLAWENFANALQKVETQKTNMRGERVSSEWLGALLKAIPNLVQEGVSSAVSYVPFTRASPSPANLSSIDLSHFPNVMRKYNREQLRGMARGMALAT
jgi:hypothetical protein